jgi:hypothetical protein
MGAPKLYEHVFPSVLYGVTYSHNVLSTYFDNHQLIDMRLGQKCNILLSPQYVLYIPWILRINLFKATNPKDELV